MSFFYGSLDDEFEQGTESNCEEELEVNDLKNSNNDEADDEDDDEDDDEISKMSEQVKVLKEEVKNLKDLNLRLRAEFENFKKRTTKEKLGLYSSGQVDCVAAFLPFFDGMERGFETFSKEAAESEASKGFKMLVDSFNQVLKKLEIESFGEKGDEFNPKIHNAIKTLEVEGFGNNLVYEVLQKGYCKGENVVRHAIVVVANP